MFKKANQAIQQLMSLVSKMLVKLLLVAEFKVEHHMLWVWAQLNRSYKNYRFSLKKNYFNPFEDLKEACANVPPDIEKEDWIYLVNFWSSSDWKKVSTRNKANRAANAICHTSGSKSFMQRAEEEREKIGQEIGRLRLWEVTHTKLNGQAVNESTQEKLQELKNIEGEVNEGSLQMNEDEIFVKVFGPKRHGRVRGFVAGATPTDLWGPKSSSTIICDLQTKLQESERNRKESDAKVKTLENKMSRVEELLAQLLGGKVA